MLKIKMKKIIITLIVSLFLIGIVSAGNATIGGNQKITPIKMCKVTADISQATEQITTTKQVQVMQNITKTITMDDIKGYYDAWKIYSKKTIEERNKMKRPIPEDYKGKKVITKVIQVPVTTNVTKYKIDFLVLKIMPYQVSVPVYKNETTTENKLKDGYTLDSSTGIITTMVQSKGGKC